MFGFFSDKETEKAKAFLSVAGLIDDQIFAVVSDEKVIKELEAEDDEVVLFKNVSSFTTNTSSFFLWVIKCYSHVKIINTGFKSLLR